MDYDKVSLLQVSEGQHAALEALLARVREEYQARLVLLVESCGRPIAESGSDAGTDVEAVASLVASLVAAAGHLANALGQPGLTLALQHGEQDRIHLVPAGPVVLAVLLNEESTQGLARVRARLRRTRHLQHIESILAPAETKPAELFSGDRVAEEELDRTLSVLDVAAS